ncbi:hypothetical protein [Amycolatopsis sp.]|jgi:hypothetical protein|uniref:hypothetical protein n=1 Tax=Amycolatopsis sp. TaxID=37632 RepID=UPI002E0A1219|nr:hypothetical protein [Amycolatopsis sp.]
MRHEDVELLGRIHKVNSAAGRMVLQVLSGAADDDALSADYDSIGRLFRGLGEAFIARSIELSPLVDEPKHVGPGGLVEDIGKGEQEAGESSDAP